ncbi:non-ribosomal peptide synthetase [Bacillus cereus group sp. TH150LC]|uniref:non-ribosomal peptide synthetase n=1 Tax=Bacillus cereus group sp. TH150LC TaxID=3018061 RepID=UPI0022E4E359|nr:non-ribosomal peptide synthetase [Bacillus cereus group sp. TH150LC]MDA1656359.1 amino acid adenylation domain-containing protein [Bacillus cereus group sp. TH150LC]
MNKLDILENLSSIEKRKLLNDLMHKKGINRKVYPLTYQQKRLWYFNELEENKKNYNIPYSIMFDGQLSIPLLRQSIQQIVSNHESLRTHFIEIDGNPYQQVSPNLTVDIPVFDLTNLNRENQEHSINSYREQVANHIFDLRKGPLFQFLLLKLTENKHILILNFHHIISDGGSLKIFFEDLESIYTSFLTGNPECLTKAAFAYGNYAVTQQNSFHDRDFKQEKEYWRCKLKDANLLIDLPVDDKRPPVQTYHGENFSFVIPKHIKEHIVDLATQYNTTVYTVLLSAFGLLLNRYTSQETILVGTPVSLRDSKELERTIGFFVNTLVIKMDFSTEITFKQLLKLTREEIISSLENKNFPFEKIVEELKIDRNLSHNPIFQVMFSYEDSSRQIELPNLTATPEVITNGVSKFDLTLNIYQNADNLYADFEYNKDIFNRSTILRYSQHFLTLLKDITLNSNKSLHDLNILRDNEKDELLDLGNHQKTTYSNNFLVTDMVERIAKEKPNHKAICYESQFISYYELENKSNQLANYLLRRGIKKGSLIGIYMGKSIETFISIIAVLKAGGAYVPLDPSYPRERIQYMIQNSNLSTIFTKKSYLKDLNDINITKISLDTNLEFKNEPILKPNLNINVDNLAYVIYTSGTTGDPKGVMVQHNSLSSIANSWFNEFGLNELDVRILQIASPSFDVFTGDLIKVLVSGGTLFVCPDDFRIDFSKLYNLIRKNDINVLESTPMLIIPFMEYVYENQLDIGCLKLLIIGSDKLPAHEYKWLIEKFGNYIQIVNSYGVTEATIDSSYYQFKKEKKSLSQFTNTPIGKPLSNTSFYILNKHLHLQPRGVVGELFIGGRGVSKGYLQNSDLTSQKFIQNPFNTVEKIYKTGDLARWNDDGDVEIIGRTDDQVKLRGYRIELGEIEEALQKSQFVQDSAVIIQNGRLVAFIVPCENYNRSNMLHIKECLKQSLPNFMVPSVIVEIESIPQTPNGKIDRKHLQNTNTISASNSSGKNKFEILTESLPRTILEYEIQQMWKEVLGINNIRLMDNFFDIGGHSLLLVQLLAKIRKKYKVDIPLPSFYSNATIEDLSSIINGKINLETGSPLTCIQSKGSKTPIFVFHQIGGYWFRYLELIQQLGNEHPIYGLSISNPYGDYDNLIDIAFYYIKEIKKVQPEGPYILLGHSLGGNIAFEIGLQLQEIGEKIGFLALLDTYLPPYKTGISDFELLLDYIERYNLSAEQLKLFENMSPNERIAYILELGKKQNYLALDVDFEEMKRILTVYLKLNRALATYPKPLNLYKGDIHFFRAIKEDIDSTLGWDDHIDGDLNIHQINSTHGVMLTNPYVQEISKIIQKNIDKI